MALTQIEVGEAARRDPGAHEGQASAQRPIFVPLARPEEDKA